MCISQVDEGQGIKRRGHFHIGDKDILKWNDLLLPSLCWAIFSQHQSGLSSIFILWTFTYTYKIVNPALNMIATFQEYSVPLDISTLLTCGNNFINAPNQTFLLTFQRSWHVLKLSHLFALHVSLNNPFLMGCTSNIHPTYDMSDE